MRRANVGSAAPRALGAEVEFARDPRRIKVVVGPEGPLDMVVGADVTARRLQAMISARMDLGPLRLDDGILHEPSGKTLGARESMGEAGVMDGDTVFLIKDLTAARNASRPSVNMKIVHRPDGHGSAMERFSIAFPVGGVVEDLVLRCIERLELQPSWYGSCSVSWILFSKRSGLSVRPDEIVNYDGVCGEDTLELVPEIVD